MTNEVMTGEPAGDLTTELARVDWLQTTPRALVERMTRESALACLRRGQTLYSSGDEPGRFFVLLQGRVGAGRPRYSPGSPATGTGTATGTDDVVWYYMTNEPLTTLCLENVLSGIAFFATMTVLADDTRLLVFPAATLTRLLEDDPGTGIAIARHVARRLQAFTEEVFNTAVLDTNRRLARYLLRLAGPDGSTTPMTQHDLAARLATSRQSVNAALARFVRHGWITPDGPARYRIVDRAALESFSGATGPTGAELFI